MSLICTRAAPKAKDSPIREIKTLESYNRKESVVPFTRLIICTVGPLSVEASLGLQALDGHGIQGINLLKDLPVIVDIPKQICQSHSEDHGITILGVHRISALKTPEIWMYQTGIRI